MATNSDHVFNVVWTGEVFPYLAPFVTSQMAWSGARYRFVGNGCQPDQIALMEQFAERHPDQVVEVMSTFPDKMVAHGVCLDAVRSQRDDGPTFCFVDTDILARGPFLDDFATILEDHAGVTSGQGIWVDDPRIPPGHAGVAGEHFFAHDGFVFGCPHFALYRRGPLDETTQRWGVGFGSAGPDLSDEARAALSRAGHDYRIYDTGKIVNALLQVDGHRFTHIEHPNLLHVGGLAHFLAPPAWVVPKGGGPPEPDWARWPGAAPRLAVADHTAQVLRSLLAHDPLPPFPEGLDDDLRNRLARVRTALVELIDNHGD